MISSGPQCIKAGELIKQLNIFGLQVNNLVKNIKEPLGGKVIGPLNQLSNSHSSGKFSERAAKVAKPVEPVLADEFGVSSLLLRRSMRCWLAS